MENELTHNVQMPYPVGRPMEDTAEIHQPSSTETPEEELSKKKKKVQQPKAKPRNFTPDEQQKIIDALKKEQNEGRGSLTPEQKKLLAEIRVPSGGASDGYFEKFPAERFENTGLANVANELRNRGLASQITNERVREILDFVNEEIGSGRVNDEVGRDFQRIVSEIGTAQATGQPYEGERPAPNRELTPDEKIQQMEDRLEAKRLNREQRMSTAQSMQEVAINIINDEGEERWGKDGVYPLLNKDLSINRQHFLIWARERMLFHHNNNSTDPGLQLLREVGLANEFGSKIPIVTMLENRQQYFRDIVAEETLDELADQLTTEVWLFGVSRNNDITYQIYMGSDEKMPEYLNQIHAKEEFTRDNNLERIMTMSDEYKKGEDGKIKKDTKVGDVVRKGYEVLYYVSDIEKLKELLGEDSDYFKAETFKEAFQILEKKRKNENIEASSQEIIDRIFPGGKMNPAEFIKLMNPFNEKTKKGSEIAIMREVLRITLAKKYGLNYGLDEDPEEGRDAKGTKVASRRDLVRTNLVYGELWGWTMARWTGVDARNDTSAIGYDAFTKTTKFQDYRIRQAAETRAAKFGNEYDLPVFKSLSVDLLNGIFVEKKPGEGSGQNLTPFELMGRMDEIENMGQREGWSNEKIIEEKEKIAERFRFERYTQITYTGDHTDRVYKIYHSMMGAEEMKLEEIVKRDPFQGVIFDRGKFEEQIKDGFLKPMRYAFSTYAPIDFGKDTRELDKKATRAAGRPIYKDVPLAEAMFGPEITSSLKREMRDSWKKIIYKRFKDNPNATVSASEATILSKKKLDIHSEEFNQLWKEYLSNPNLGRSTLWKRASMARIAAQIKSHREYGNGYQYFNMEMVEKFYDALRKIRAVEVEEDNEETRMRYGEYFLTKDDIAWIRQHSKTGYKKMLAAEIGKGAGYGVLKGGWEGLNDFIKDIFK